MKTDDEIRCDVAEELHWTPDVVSDDIVVKVDGGIVTLTGSVPSHSDKYQAECAAKRVIGVIGIANDIRVRTCSADRPSDTSIAQEAAEAIRSDLPHVADHVQVVVRDGHLTLEGSVEWQWQRQRLESTVRAIKGVAVVNNLLAIEPRVAPNDIKRRIEDAFRRSAEVDAQSVTVEARDSEVILRGAVRSLYEKDEAQRTAWSAPGVTRVVNEITVSP
ncbi:MAG TPA: BON domain-containing protein [Steroidobacteraceae bacterium]|nr:BON domain-containing protein [Steroidobacteraceae bacterium]